MKLRNFSQASSWGRNIDCGRRKKKPIFPSDNEEELITNVDGEKGPSFPIDLEILPDRLSVFVPEKIKEDNSLFPHLLEGIQPKLRLP